MTTGREKRMALNHDQRATAVAMKIKFIHCRAAYNQETASPDQGSNTHRLKTAKGSG